MVRALFRATSGLALAAVLAVAQPPGRAGCCGLGPASGALVDIKGIVEKVRISPGMGMPFVEIKTAAETVTLYLGSMRYLMAQDFNPRTGDEITAKAYKTQNGYLAATVTLPGRNKTVRLRDEEGRPVWRGGPPW